MRPTLLRPVKGEPPRLRVRDYVVLFPLALKATYEDGCLGFAKGAAYSALLAFFPLLATSATILVRTRANWVSQNIADFLARILPPGTEDLVFDYFATRGGRPALLPVTAVLLSIWAASGAIVSLMQGFKAVYRIPSGRPFLRERAIAVLLVFSAAIPALVASLLIVLGNRAEQAIGTWLGLLPRGAELQGWVSVASTVVRYAIALASIALGATILYRYGPNRPQRWRRAWPGAVVATWLWLGSTLGFAWYVRNIANYNVMYGSIAAAILLLVWMYVLAVIAFIGCEFNAVYERAAGHAPMV
jgi:membrane protein